MSKNKRILKIFLASTFVKVEEELNILYKSVFPKLEEYCREKNFQLKIIDSRLAVDEKHPLNYKILEIFINKLFIAQQLSVKPAVLILMGKEIGWQPLPYRIPFDDIFQFSSKISNEDEIFIHEWYKEITGGEFFLQPRKNEYMSFNNWHFVEKKLKFLFRNLVIWLTIKKKRKYFASAIQRIVEEGVFCFLNDPSNSIENIFPIVQETNKLPKKKCKTSANFDEKALEDISVKQFEDFKSELKNKFDDNYFAYVNEIMNTKCSWNELKNRIFVFLKKNLDLQMETELLDDEIEDEKYILKDVEELAEEEEPVDYEKRQRVKTEISVRIAEKNFKENPNSHQFSWDLLKLYTYLSKIDKYEKLLIEMENRGMKFKPQLMDIFNKILNR